MKIAFMQNELTKAIIQIISSFSMIQLNSIHY